MTTQIRYGSVNVKNIIDGSSVDLIEIDSFEAFVIFESMTAPCLSAKLYFKDIPGKTEELIKVGKCIIDVDIMNEVVDNAPTIPSMYGYDFKKGGDEQFNSQNMWVISCMSLDYIQQQSSDTHLELTDEDVWESDDWMIPVHEYVEKLHYSHDTDATGMSQMSYRLEYDETHNYVWYRPKTERGAESLGRDEELTIGQLIEQAAENACAKENPNAVNFFYWQGLENWNFKSVENLSKQDSVKTYKATMDASRMEKIINPPMLSSLNELQLLDSGAFFSTMEYTVPKIREELKKDWYSANIKTFYYRTNCVQRTNFPAAIIGFNPIDYNENLPGNPYRWQYAFVEVFMEWDIEAKRATFRVKPIDKFPIRSNIQFIEREPDQNKEDSIEVTEDYFTEPAYNLLEVGNDGFYDPETMEGWESPGFRVDTQLWAESCMKLQPIRGSEPKSMGEFVNSTDVQTLPEDATFYADGEDITGKFPIVDMKIYWDTPQEGSEEISKPHYFFSVANTTDGECEEDETLMNEGDCERP